MASSVSDCVDAALPLMDPLDVELLAEVGYSISYASKIVIARLTAYGKPPLENKYQLWK